MIGLVTLGDNAPLHWVIRLALIFAGLTLALPGGISTPTGSATPLQF
jgi:hypothetical protein